MALLALWGGVVLADQVQFGDFTYSVNGDSVIIMDYPESGKGTAVIPDTIKGKPVTSIANNTFAYCAGVTNIIIPDSVTKISDYAFNQCAALTAITVNRSHSIFSSVDGILLNKIGSTLIQYPGGKAGSYTIPNSVTTIGDNAFYFSPGLTNVTIPASVSSIGNWAFMDCTKLTSLYFEGNAPKYGAGKFSGVDTKKLKLHIYEGSTGFEMAQWDIHPKIMVKRPAK